MVMAIPKEVLDTKIIPQIPMGRLGKPDEVAGLVAYLCLGRGGVRHRRQHRHQRRPAHAVTEGQVMGTDVDMKLEVVVIPVSDVDRAKAVLREASVEAGRGHRAGTDFRVVQFTPPGSACSVQFGTGVTSAAPGSAQGLPRRLRHRGGARRAGRAAASTSSEVFHDAGGGYNRFDTERAGERPRSGAAQLRARSLIVQRPGRQRLAAPGDHHPIPRPRSTRRRRRSPPRARPGERAAARGGRPRRAREAHRRAGRELARLVRRVHGGGAGRQGASPVGQRGAGHTRDRFATKHPLTGI